MRDYRVTAKVSLSVMIGCFLVTGHAADRIYTLEYATYFGASNYDIPAGDSVVDEYGNLYVVGATKSTDFPTTPGAFDRTHGGSPFGGDAYSGWDAFITKFDPKGNIIWSTLLGGPARDELNAVRIDPQGNVIVGGSFGPDAPTTPGSLQPDFAGDDSVGVNKWDGFIAKFNPDGRRLWATYLGTGAHDLVRSLDVDSEGNIVAGSSYNGKAYPSGWFTNAYQKTPRGGLDTVVVKVSKNGDRALWATYLGGSGKDDDHANIALDAADNVHVASTTRSNDIPTTSGAHDRTWNGREDVYVAKLSADGRKLLFGTFLGGSNTDGSGGKRGVAVDATGNTYVGVWTKSSDYPTTVGAYRSTPLEYSSWGVTQAISKLSPTGVLLASTYMGTSEGISIDSSGDVCFSTETRLANFPVTVDAFQRTIHGGSDAAMVKFSSDLRTILYASYFGGSGDDQGRGSAVGPNGDFYMLGTTKSKDLPTKNASQGRYRGSTDGFVVKVAISYGAGSSTGGSVRGGNRSEGTEQTGSRDAKSP